MQHEHTLQSVRGAITKSFGRLSEDLCAFDERVPFPPDTNDAAGRAIRSGGIPAIPEVFPCNEVMLSDKKRSVGVHTLASRGSCGIFAYSERG
ncbi:hypothetical protein A6U87_13695 [Rhizobium sp. AC44/96]|nr:hypothetical protein A6U87_13695 [Rhizobium sp. AC44/96]